MATTLKLRRGTTAQHSSFTGAAGEVTVDTDKETVVVHDGSTAGGFPLAKENGTTFTNVDINSGAIDNTTIGGATAAAITGTTITANTSVSTDTISEKTSAAGVTVDGVVLKDNGASLGGNLTFTGTGNRITGDFNNATVANRVMFQNSVTNGITQIPILPNGTGTTAAILPFNNSDSTNAAFFLVGARSIDAALVSGITGTGTYVPMTFATGGSERMRIDTSGNLLVGTTTTIGGDNKFSVKASGTWTGFFQTSGANGVGITNDTGTTAYTAFGFFNGGTSYNQQGSIAVNASSTTYNTSSDYRLKHDIQPMTGALAKVAALKPCTYKWKVDGSAGQGFIAHELQAVCPDAVSGEKDAVDADGKPQYQGVDTSFLVATLTAAIKELKAELDTVKAELATLKG